MKLTKTKDPKQGRASTIDFYSQFLPPASFNLCLFLSICVRLLFSPMSQIPALLIALAGIFGRRVKLLLVKKKTKKTFPALK